MANITTQDRIARQLDSWVMDTDGLSMLQHFDYPETWSYEGNAAFTADDAKFGKGCVHFPEIGSKAVVTNNTGMFDILPFGNYEIECFIKIVEAGSVIACGEDLVLAVISQTVNENTIHVLQLSSDTWGINITSTIFITLDTWHHILLRITGGYAYLFVDGVQALKAYISSQTAITPERVELGGYVGYMDEFVFRRNAGSGTPTVPTEAYEMSTPTRIPTKDAPVTSVMWSAEGLPEGLTLSESGQLTGHPTTAGSYDSTVTVTTNWGTASKTVRIKVS